MVKKRKYICNNMIKKIKYTEEMFVWNISMSELGTKTGYYIKVSLTETQNPIKIFYIFPNSMKNLFLATNMT